MSFTDQPDRLIPMSGASKSSAFYEENALHFFRSTVTDATTAMASTLSSS